MIRINLLPVRAAKKKESIRFQLTVAGLITFFVVALVAMVYFTVSSEATNLSQELASGEEELRELNRKIGELAKIKDDKKVVEEKLRIIERLEAGRKGPVKLFVSISEAIPDRAWLKSLRDRGNVVVLTGYAATDDAVADFMRRLGRYRELGKVELEVAKSTKEKEWGREVVNFTIRLEKK